ncbi:LysM peptidoglycan-binding domain-containing protein [Symbiobacterium thermophilum]|uniref:LysM domain-containing protein n=1 Tax=Symbiobacterium thermophilum (strain DSM 24528 / JCM 14929 / IAM 14863 / T) TaxID=292459 RepID=Q67RG8_SYMTH|nr:LysM domain-containing protein [Symbiobacterium thermophilum]BAD39725.1 hypothetical protein STH740 [Symbiobacterium thermophilum IAM 14863]
MQTMTSKTRTSLVIGGVAALVLVISLAIYAVTQRSQSPAESTNPLEQIAEPENGTPLSTSPTSNPSATANPSEAGTGTSQQAAGTAPADGSDAAAGTEDGTTPAMTRLEAVPAIHIVQPNETLYEISQKYYNTHIYAGDIEALNGLENPDQIYAGMELRLPQPSELPGYGQ